MARVATRVAVALGSNLGDRRGHLAWAVEQLAGLLDDIASASIIETEPFDVPDDQPPYLNTVVVGVTDRSPRDLLDRLLALERARGRHRRGAKAARTLDLDLILFGDQVIDAPGLVVPHPRFRERRFVLEPLAGVAGEWVDPVTGTSVAGLLAGLAGDDRVQKKGAGAVPPRPRRNRSTG